MSEYRDIPGFIGYRISRSGEVYRGERKLVPSAPAGKMRVQLHHGGRNTSRLVEDLIRAAWDGGALSVPTSKTPQVATESPPTSDAAPPSLAGKRAQETGAVGYTTAGAPRPGDIGALDVIPIEALTKPTDRFRCEPLRAVLSARACIANQTSHNDDRKYCRFQCLIGAVIRRRIETKESTPSGRLTLGNGVRTSAFIAPNPNVLCPCGKAPPQAIRSRNGLRDLAHLCAGCRREVMHERAKARERAGTG